jgi:hypothetical protein
LCDTLRRLPLAERFSGFLKDDDHKFTEHGFEPVAAQACPTLIDRLLTAPTKCNGHLRAKLSSVS